ncbi:MAG: hypothetical protein AAB631_02740 [Patescibacteria group bacterium]
MTNRILIGLAALLVVILIGTVAVKNIVGESEWSAVYLKTGELYFGHLTRFPYFALTNVYMLQANPSSPQTPLSIQKFSKVFWGPEDKLRINRTEVVWMTELEKNGQLAQILNTNPELQASQGDVNQPQLPAEFPPQYPNPTSTRR